MTATVFRDAEASYLSWLGMHPVGFVLTTPWTAPASYMSLHKATCSKISRYMTNMEAGAFTERGYMKICSVGTTELLAWIWSKGGSGFTKLCSTCRPAVESGQLARPSFEALVEQARQDGSAARKERLMTAPKRPTFRTTTTIVFDRNPDVVAEVSERANGVCERCHKAAPFVRRKDRSPYLEVHHRIRLADGGEDTVNNAIALCPNCHRYQHNGSVG